MHQPDIKVRKMKTSDIPLALFLTTREGWLFDEYDFRLMLRLWPMGNFVIQKGNRVIGFGSVMAFGKDGWLSNYIISPRMRGKGLGSLLVEKSLNFAKVQELRSVSLYTYRERADFYRRFGFIDDWTCTRYEGQAQNTGKEKITSNQIKQLRRSTFENLVKFDKSACGVDRGMYLNYLLKYYPHNLFYASEGSKISGFICARSDPDGGYEIGQLVCCNRETARSLVEYLLKKTGNTPIWVIAPDCNTNAKRLFLELGLLEGRRYLKMRWGVVGGHCRANMLYTSCALD